MKTSRTKLAPATRRLVTEVYGRLDYGALGPVYCYEGGDEFWRAKRGLCNRLGSRVAVRVEAETRTGRPQSLRRRRGGGASCFDDGNGGAGADGGTL